MKVVKFGIVGLGLMGRELASAMARWCHLPGMEVKLELVAICGKPKSPEIEKWFTDNFSSIKQVTDDYRAICANKDIEAVYCAVPHNLHEEIYCALIESGKHLLGEKPFGIDKNANDKILSCIKKHPGVFVRCSSEFPFYPAVQRICGMIEKNAFGAIIEVNAGFLHSSDINPDKPINWKRMIEYNGEYGCMGDLGMHVCHVPFRAGWIPGNTRAVLSKIVKERPDGKGGRVPCKTWDNAVLMCEVTDPLTKEKFPMTLKTYRIAPGEKNTWYIEIIGTKASVRFSTKNPKLLQYWDYEVNAQNWQNIDTGQETAFKSITGEIFEFGFSDAILQMEAAFLYELVNKRPLKKFAGCVTPEETAISHRLFTAALKSQEETTVINI
ncbi:MAG: Gfo/Idh/MocA family oxidoreductase [Elusimicrobia bacterium]|nr:Gfo/Idh/MocA family oxidoreductase [Elusimicrobiota bacterium]MBU2614330.1 Gfo/Idh/MocA family oxidoreductase [Elusimicrobiota bacterium]